MGTFLRTLLLIASIVVAFALGHAYGGRVPSPHKQGGRTAYTCPMHPILSLTTPGNCPMCGMQLMPYVTGSGAAGRAMPGRQVAPGAELLAQERAGIAVVPVSEQSFTSPVRLVGRVMADEARTVSVSAGIDGYVSEVADVVVGSRVHRGQHLATVSAPDAVSAAQSYLVALDAVDRLRKEGADGELRATPAAGELLLRQRLAKAREVGYAEAQLEAMRSTRDVPVDLAVVAPRAGVVMARDIAPGQRFMRGAEWYRIADLSRVTVVAELPATDAPSVQAHMTARLFVPGQKAPVSARVRATAPEAMSGARAVTVRLEADNAGQLLVPGQVVAIEIPVASASALLVPEGAVLQRGAQPVTFVEVAPGLHERRPVVTGRRVDGKVEIVKGVQSGERVVAAGALLVDAEGRTVDALARPMATRARTP